jgi:hypothetical protein
MAVPAVTFAVGSALLTDDHSRHHAVAPTKRQGEALPAPSCGDRRRGRFLSPASDAAEPSRGRRYPPLGPRSARINRSSK